MRPQNGWVEIDSVQPVFDRLIEIYGTKAQVAKAMGIHKQGFLHPDKRLIQRATLNKALDLLAEHETQSSNNNVPLLVVNSEKFALILRKWVIEFLVHHERYEYNDKNAGPTKVLAQLSGYSQRVVSGYINNTREVPQEWTDVNAADRLLTAIDQQYKLSNGELPVIANPALSMEAWVKRMEARGCI